MPSLLLMPMLPTSMVDTTAIPTTEDTDTDITGLDTTVSVSLATPDTLPPMSPGPSRASAVNVVKLRLMPMPMLTTAMVMAVMAILMAVDTTVVDTMVDMVTDMDTDTDTTDRFRFFYSLKPTKSIEWFNFAIPRLSYPQKIEKC